MLHLAINALETAQEAVPLWPAYVLKQLDNLYMELKNDDKRT